MKHDYLLLGEVVRPQGIHGEVKLRHYTDDPERFLELKTVYREREGRYEPIGVTGARVREDDVFLMLEGVRDRNAAEALRGVKLWVDRAHAPRMKSISPIFWGPKPTTPREAAWARCARCSPPAGWMCLCSTRPRAR